MVQEGDCRISISNLLKQFALIASNIASICDLSIYSLQTREMTYVFSSRELASNKLEAS